MQFPISQPFKIFLRSESEFGKFSYIKNAWQRNHFIFSKVSYARAVQAIRLFNNNRMCIYFVGGNNTRNSSKSG